MIIIPNVNKENSCLDCPIWSLCWDDKPTEDICKDRCPIIELKEHGHWIWDKENDKMYCSKCGYETDDWGVNQAVEWQFPNYCANCGIKMDEVELINTLKNILN